MNQPVGSMLLTLALLSSPMTARAHEDRDAEGKIDAIDQSSLTVNGTVYHVDERTDFDDGLQGLADLKVGDRVEIDFVVSGERRIAREIELEA